MTLELRRAIIISRVY